MKARLPIHFRKVAPCHPFIKAMAYSLALSCVTVAEAQEPAANKAAPVATIAKVAFAMPAELEPVLADHYGESQRLVGRATNSAAPERFARKVAEYLRGNGYLFANVTVKPDPNDASNLSIIVLPGKTGVGNVDGNAWVSEAGVLGALGWDEGETFHYARYHAAATALNRHRFITVDTKLRPRRTDDGGIVVDADFGVNDGPPVVVTGGVANDGVRISSGWRSNLGIEWWEPFREGDRLSLTWTTDPGDVSQLNGYSVQYAGEPGSTINWALFGGYTESEYDDVITAVDIDVMGEGLHLGFAGSRRLAEFSGNSLDLSFALTYLRVSNETSFYGQNYGDEDLSLLLPRLALEASLPQLFGLSGQTYLSLGVLTDAGTTDDADLANQRANASSGFAASNLRLTTFQPFGFGPEGMGLFLNMEGQATDDVLPVSLQKSIGGVRTVRGYREREVFGDQGLHLNAEVRFPSIKATLPGGEVGKGGSVQPLFFYDYGYVKSKSSLAGSDDDMSLSSFGVGLTGSWAGGFNSKLYLGVPLETAPHTKQHDARVHFELNFRY